MGVVGEEFSFINSDKRYELRKDHTRSLTPMEVIFPISATLELNSQMASAFRISLQKKLWNFLIPDGEAEDFLIKNVKEFTNNVNDSEVTAFFLNPYINTGLMVGECINLDMSIVSGKVKLTEKSGCYKDRYSTISYCNWILSFFDQDLLKETEDNSMSDLEFLTSITKVW